MSDQLPESAPRSPALPGWRRRMHRRASADSAETRTGKPAGWLLTYSDMITLLMAFFIGLIAFYARGPAATGKPSGSSANDRGEDIARLSASFDSSTTMWRVRSTSAQPEEAPGKRASFHRNPPTEAAETILRQLGAASPEALAGSHAVRLPVGLLFDEHNRLSASGGHLLHAIATGVRPLPCELHFHAEKSGSLARAVDLCSYLMLQEGILPARLAVGSHPPAEGAGEGIWLIFVRHN